MAVGRETDSRRGVEENRLETESRAVGDETFWERRYLFRQEGRNLWSATEAEGLVRSWVGVGMDN
jgi:hypothetical protein